MMRYFRVPVHFDCKEKSPENLIHYQGISHHSAALHFLPLVVSFENTAWFSVQDLPGFFIQSGRKKKYLVCDQAN